MKPDNSFIGLGKDFWAHVRSLSQTIGYTERGKGTIKVPTFKEILEAMDRLTLFSDHLVTADGVTPSDYANRLIAYFRHRAGVLNNTVQHQLQTKEQAEAMYLRLKTSIPSARVAAKNKQKGEKATIAYLTAMVNLLIEASANGVAYDHDPRQLTTVTQDGKPLRTLARRVDGAFPSVVNPVAIWEIKEYYHTTTFGSRVADGVYETLLDGMELEEMRNATGIDIQHLLILDAHYTWWECGRSYLCRMIDMLHMGYVDEILFGTEIESRIPVMVGEWLALVQEKQKEGADKPRPHGQTELV
jgi:hypothetical protein